MKNASVMSAVSCWDRTKVFKPNQMASCAITAGKIMTMKGGFYGNGR